MTQDKIIELVDANGSRLSIKALRRPYRQSNDPDDSEWLSCNIGAHAAGLGGNLTVNLMITELELLRTLLFEMLRGERKSGQFSATEAFLQLEISRNSRGSFDVHVAITKHDSTAMRFEFDMPALSAESIKDYSASIGLMLL
jgi:hypothetical protein